MALEVLWFLTAPLLILPADDGFILYLFYHDVIIVFILMFEDVILESQSEE